MHKYSALSKKLLSAAGKERVFKAQKNPIGNVLLWDPYEALIFSTRSRLSSNVDYAPPSSAPFSLSHAAWNASV